MSLRVSSDWRVWRRLEAIRTNPRVTVRRGDHDIRYEAAIWNGETSREHIDGLFRAKYGVLDQISAWVWRRNEVPIRLNPR